MPDHHHAVTLQVQAMHTRAQLAEARAERAEKALRRLTNVHAWFGPCRNVEAERDRLAWALFFTAAARQHEHRQVVDWLVNDLDYPIDWSTPVPRPPVWLRRAIEDAWVRRDGGAWSDDDIRQTVAEEGGWA
ncbi:MAG TPA: hypothetical protein VM328_10995 [Fimbriimonadaceae bacterium]|nr:hypothetical protein [Fimbriimonadaceae bacterium]